MQVCPDRVVRIAGIIALFSEEGSSFYEHFICSGGEFSGNERIPIGVSHVSVINPDLCPGIERIGRDTNDDSRAPSGQAGQETGVGCHDPSFIDTKPAKNIYPLVAVSQFEGIIPQVADETIGRKDKGSIAAVCTSLDNPLGMGLRIERPSPDID